MAGFIPTQNVKQFTDGWKSEPRLRVASEVEDIYLSSRLILMVKSFCPSFMTTKNQIACLNYVEKARKEQRLNSGKGKSDENEEFEVRQKI
jgi:hypothetical protein